MRRGSNHIANEIHELSKKPLEKQLRDSYIRGLEAAHGGTVERVPQAHAEYLRNIQNQAKKELRQAAQFQRRDTERFINEVNKAKNRRYATAVLNNRPIAAKEVLMSDGGIRHYQMDTYVNMIMAHHQSQAYNTAKLLASSGVAKFFQVSDGNECGWRDHLDPDKANGKIVTLEEALSNTLAHPYCVRQFWARSDLKNKPKTGRARKAVKALGGAAAAGVGVAAVVQAKNALHNGAIEKFLSSNSLFLKFQHGLEETKRSIDDIERQIAAFEGRDFLPVDIEELADDVTTHGESWVTDRKPLPHYVLEILGLDGTESDDIIGNRLFDFERFTAAVKRRGMDVSLIEHADSFEEGMRSALKQAAGDYQMMGWSRADIFDTRLSFPQQGRNLLNFWPRVTWFNNDMIRSWTNLTDALKFMSAKELRHYAAERGYDIINDKGHYKTRKELIQELGGWKLGMMHRVSLNPRGVIRGGFQVSPTGQLIPNFRLVPKNLPFRVETEWRQRRMFKNEIIQKGREMGIGGLKEAMTREDLLRQTGIVDDIVRYRATTVVLHPPVLPEIRLNFHNNSFQSVVFEMRSFANFLRGSVRINRQGWRNMRVSIGSKGGAVKLKTVVNEMVIEDDEGGKTVISERKWLAKSNLIKFIPDKYRQFTRFLLRFADDTEGRYGEKLPWLHGGVMQIARILNQPWQDVQEIVKRVEFNYKSLLRKVRGPDEYDGIADNVIMMHPEGRIGSYRKITSNDIPLAGIEVGVREGRYPQSFLDDIRKVQNYFEERFPKAAQPDWVVNEIPTYDPKSGKGSFFRYRRSTNNITIDPRVIETWEGRHRQVFQEAVHKNHFPKTLSPNPIASAVHEMGHSLNSQMTKQEIVGFWHRILKATDDSGWDFGGGSRQDFLVSAGSHKEMYEQLEEFFRRPKNQKIIHERLSSYASENPWEFMSEALSEGLSASQPRVIARVATEYLEEIFNDGKKRHVLKIDIVPKKLLTFFDKDGKPFKKLTELLGRTESYHPTFDQRPEGVPLLKAVSGKFSKSDIDMESVWEEGRRIIDPDNPLLKVDEYFIHDLEHVVENLRYQDLTEGEKKALVKYFVDDLIDFNKAVVNRYSYGLMNNDIHDDSRAVHLFIRAADNNAPFPERTQGHHGWDDRMGHYEIVISEDRIIDWLTSHERYTMHAPGTENPMSVLTHEFAHHLTRAIENTTDAEDGHKVLRKLERDLDKALGLTGDDTFENGEFLSGARLSTLDSAKWHRIMDKMGMTGSYATENGYEFIAEAMVEYLHAPNPRQHAVAIGKAFDDFFKIQKSEQFDFYDPFDGDFLYASYIDRKPGKNLIESAIDVIRELDPVDDLQSSLVRTTDKLRDFLNKNDVDVGRHYEEISHKVMRAYEEVFPALADAFEHYGVDKVAMAVAPIGKWSHVSGGILGAFNPRMFSVFLNENFLTHFGKSGLTIDRAGGRKIRNVGTGEEELITHELAHMIHELIMDHAWSDLGDKAKMFGLRNERTFWEVLGGPGVTSDPGGTDKDDVADFMRRYPRAREGNFSEILSDPDRDLIQRLSEVYGEDLMPVLGNIVFANDAVTKKITDPLQGRFMRVPDFGYEQEYQKFRRWIASELSEYAGDNLAELIAEAMSEFMLSDSPRPIAVLVADWAEEWIDTLQYVD